MKPVEPKKPKAKRAAKSRAVAPYKGNHPNAQPTPQADPFISMIERASRDPAVDIGKMKELLAMRAEEQQRIAEQEAKTKVRRIAK